MEKLKQELREEKAKLFTLRSQYNLAKYCNKSRMDLDKAIIQQIEVIKTINKQLQSKKSSNRS